MVGVAGNVRRVVVALYAGLLVDVPRARASGLLRARRVRRMARRGAGRAAAIGSGERYAEAEQGERGAIGGFPLATAGLEALEVVADGDVFLIGGVVVEGGQGGGDGLLAREDGQEAVAAGDGGFEIVQEPRVVGGPAAELGGGEVGTEGGVEEGEVWVEISLDDGVVDGRFWGREGLGRRLLGAADGGGTVEVGGFGDHAGMISG